MMTSFKSTVASLDSLKGDVKLPATQLPLSPPSSTKAPSLAGSDTATDPVEDYNGAYRFAPIKEHHVARAMSTRYGADLVRTAVSDMVIVGGPRLPQRLKVASSLTIVYVSRSWKRWPLRRLHSRQGPSRPLDHHHRGWCVFPRSFSPSACSPSHSFRRSRPWWRSLARYVNLFFAVPDPH